MLHEPIVADLALQPPTASAPEPGGSSFAEAADAFDRRLKGRAGEVLGGQSPWAAVSAWADWAFHLSISPGRMAALSRRWLEATTALAGQAGGGEPQDWAFRPEQGDRRFRHPGWSRPPFSLLAQAQLAAEAQWRAATDGVRGVEAHHARRVAFLGGFALNALAPVNFPWSNPEVVEAAWASGGANFLNGAALLADDVGRLARGEAVKGQEAFAVGETLAVTPGEVVFRNDLMELIQYAPTTDEVRREPILITPAWIMKYYILDLTPPDSLVRYLTAQGFTVFIISWRNPGADLREASFEDYRLRGVMAALDEVGRIVPDEKVHAVGYCLGGTVLAIAAAAMDRGGDLRLASVTLLAAQTDFDEAGELMLFIDESQLALLEDMMDQQGFLDARQMSSAFYALRANEMLFARIVERYLLGRATTPTDLDAWLTDATRMPARMHSEYLRQLFLENRFAHGRYPVEGGALAPKDIHAPIFALGAERDYIAPWRSVHKIQLYGAADTTFVLTGGGHNSSVVSPPGKRGAYYRIGRSAAGDDYVDPDVWAAAAAQTPGSWWPAWVSWLDGLSSPERVPARAPASALGPAPGTYVLQR
ncbi:PHA/PHB synthase family protein [Caulobacter sp. KR2-114]|uniref:PHA/PHB synthase family protein n=1 Tax=Caulobacter sp. KR2-114 TaxID=3400912 RepID=UPI003BFF4DEA